MALAEELNSKPSVFWSQESQSAILDLNPEDLFTSRSECPLVEFSRPEYEVIDPVPIIPIELTRDAFRPRSTNVVFVGPWNGSLHSSSFVNDSHVPSTKQVPSPLFILTILRRNSIYALASVGWLENSRLPKAIQQNLDCL